MYSFPININHYIQLPSQLKASRQEINKYTRSILLQHEVSNTLCNNIGSTTIVRKGECERLGHQVSRYIRRNIQEYTYCILVGKGRSHEHHWFNVWYYLLLPRIEDTYEFAEDRTLLNNSNNHMNSALFTAQIYGFYGRVGSSTHWILSQYYIPKYHPHSFLHPKWHNSREMFDYRCGCHLICFISNCSVYYFLKLLQPQYQRFEVRKC